MQGYDRNSDEWNNSVQALAEDREGWAELCSRATHLGEDAENRELEESEKDFSILPEITPFISGNDSIEKEAVRVDYTTTSSPRHDLPSKSKVAEPVSQKVDNAHYIDEETKASPFEDETPAQKANGVSGNTVTRFSSSFQADEDIEDVIMKMSLTKVSIRRAPVRESHPTEQYDEHHLGTVQTRKDAEEDLDVYKDGTKTHVPSGSSVIFIPGVTDNLVLVSSKSFVGNFPTVSEQEKSNTGQTIIAPDVELLGTASKSSLDSFYRIPVHKSVKKEKILTFCTKDVAIRDIRNMVIACGGEEDIWQPNSIAWKPVAHASGPTVEAHHVSGPPSVAVLGKCGGVSDPRSLT
ncbi:hypothetical protein RB195_022171 [Necator americanus]|uniref:Uncharacterized protein n=1 Tax=Necator americanus TaxID=51031 RepID=A0ABR1EE84_NECAM